MENEIKEIIDKQYKTVWMLIIALTVSVVSMMVITITWAWLFNQYDYETVTTTEYTIEQDGEGQNTIEGSFNGG